MFGWFKNKKKATVRYKIVPYKNLGFIIEKYVGNIDHEVYSTNIIIHKDYDKPVLLKGIFTSYTSFKHGGSPEAFNTKQEARLIIDACIAKENNEKAKAEDARRSIERFALENPPEWYP